MVADLDEDGAAALAERLSDVAVPPVFVRTDVLDDESVAAVFELDEDAELIVHDELVAGTDPAQLREVIQSSPVKALSLDD
ncbi:hypothetical protein ACWD7C_36705 [Streptomyces sp. NPDC005134]|uniref:hypothetical protein n=1 Tax=Streptomyces sp. NPDC005098 TaxID=3154560 RepID=UPI0033A1AD15